MTTSIQRNANLGSQVEKLIIKNQARTILAMPYKLKQGRIDYDESMTLLWMLELVLARMNILEEIRT